MTVGKGHAVTGDDAAIGVLTEYPAGTTGGNDDCPGLNKGEFSGSNLDHYCAVTTAIFNNEIAAEMFIKAPDRGVLHGSLKQGMQDMETGFISGKPGTLDFHAAKGTDIDVSVVLAAPWTAPVFQLHHLLAGMGDEIFNDILFTQPVPAGHGIVKMMIQIVVGLGYGCGSPFCGHGVAAHLVDF